MELLTEQFASLGSAIMRASEMPDSTKIVIPGNPEYVSDERLLILAENALEEIVDKLSIVNPKARS